MPLPVAGIIYADNRVILSPIWDRDLVSIRAKKKATSVWFDLP